MAGSKKKKKGSVSSAKVEGIDAEIVEYIKSIKFRKKTFGGVDEEQIWIVISNIQKFYESKEKETETTYKALLKERDEKIALFARELKKRGV